MTFNPNADVSDNRASKRGRNAAVAGGGVVGLGGIAALVIALLTGGSFDLNQLFGPQQQGQQQTTSDDGKIANCDTGADANASDECRVAAAQVVLDKFWASKVKGYTEPGYVIVDGQTSTPCGTASNAVGPFYCPSDQTVYVDPTFFQVMRQQFGAEAGNLAQLYVVGHEWGHHIQNITGIMQEHPNNGTGPDSNGVKTELQADCFAGGWIREMTQEKDKNGVAYMKAPTKAEINDALDAAAAVGDDNIQQKSAGYTNPESWTHGSSEQRQQWFMTGYEQGINVCQPWE